jgi:predicted dienelactone hydrolase
MKTIRFAFSLISICALLIDFNPLLAQTPAFIYGDPLPDAPELAPWGGFSVGVRTISLKHENQPDVNNFLAGQEPEYDREIKVEIWYPSTQSTQPVAVQYEDYLGLPNDKDRPLLPFTFPGKAERNAEPDHKEGPYPLVIVSHGYLGSRYLMTYLTENLASKGYVVVAIHHTESTHENPGKFASTLYHRSIDQLFVLDEIAHLGNTDRKGFLARLVDTENSALIGYSMGGYGVLNAAGAAYSPAFVEGFSKMTGGSKLLAERSLAGPKYAASVDPRIKAVVAFAPWGMSRGAWDDEGLQNLKIPTFFIAGDQDDISGYQKGVKAIYEGAINTDRYMLTYINARHNVAPNPPPTAAYVQGSGPDDYLHYSEPVWDERRINNINQHFVTAFLGIHLKGEEYGAYLDLPENSLDGPWEGFLPRTSIGLELRKQTGQ